MNAAVTGGSGFLGAALIKALADRGDTVRALIRRQEAVPQIRGLGAEPVLGDLTQPGGCDGVVTTGDTVFHAAAHVRLTGPWEKFQHTTIDGTRRLLEAALPQRPERFVYVSSGSVYALSRAPRDYCADHAPVHPPTYNFYGRAKLASERLVQALCTQAGCPWTIVRLGFLYGPGNRTFVSDFVTLAQRGKLFILGSGKNRIATLYIDDAVRAVMLAGDHPVAANRIYDVANDEPVTQRQFIEGMATAFDLPRPHRRMNRQLAFLGAWLTECLAKRAGREPRISRSLVRLMGTDQCVDVSRIRTALGWRPEVSFAEGIRQAQEWYRGLQQSEAGRPPATTSAPASRIPA